MMHFNYLRSKLLGENSVHSHIMFMLNMKIIILAIVQNEWELTDRIQGSIYVTLLEYLCWHCCPVGATPPLTILCNSGNYPSNLFICIFLLCVHDYSTDFCFAHIDVIQCLFK